MKYRIKLQRRITYDVEVIVEAQSAIAAMNIAEAHSTTELTPFEVSHSSKYVAISVTEEVTNLNPPVQ